jgi:DNA-binding transcriptional ArsR family regulator
LVTELRVDGPVDVRVALDPYVSVLALVTDALGRQRAAPQAWRERVLSSLSPRAASAVRTLTVPSYSVVPDCVTPLNPLHEVPVRDQVDWLHAASDDKLLEDLDAAFGAAPPPHWQGAMRRPRAWLDAYASAIDETWQSVEPLWARARPLLEQELARVGTAVVRGGLDLVLDRLHPASRFENQVLSIRDPEPARLSLGGRPLVLVPMLSGRQDLICNLELPDVAWIGYPLPGMGRPAAVRNSAHAQLGTVLGTVRAQIVVVADRPMTMSEIAARICLAPSAVTYHCDRLAAAGLVARDRHGREIRVSRTNRGDELIALFASDP